MSPELAKDIYYEYFFQSMLKQQLDWSKPMVQHECEMEGWAAVVDHIENDELMELPQVKAAWEAYLAEKQKANQWRVPQLWDAFKRVYGDAKERKP